MSDHEHIDTNGFILTWPILFLLVSHCGLLIGLDATSSLNRTEVAHFGSAAYLLNTGKFDLFHVNPPLVRFIVGIPIYFSTSEYDWRSYSPRSQDRSEWNVGMAFVESNPPTQIHWLYFFGRCTCMPIILLGAWYGFKLSSGIFGRYPGLAFLILWTFSPFFLGWGATLCPDMVAASLGIVAIYFFRRWLLFPSWWNVVIAGLFVGMLPLAKLTWIIAFVLFPFLWILSRKRPPMKQLIVVLLAALYVLNMGYLFDGSFSLLKDYTFISDSLRGETGNRFSNSVVGYTPVPLPREFVEGIDTQKRDFEKGLESYLFGKHQARGWWYYYFVVLSFKEPLGTLILGLLATGLLCFRREYRSTWNDEILVIVPLVVLFALMSSQTGISIHPRYLLPTLPFFYLFISRIGRSFDLKQRPVQWVLGLCLAWMVASSLWAYPYSMAYFNEILPVKERPKVLLGSNIDWGQNAYFLKAWLKKHPEASPIYIEYPCPEGVERIGIESAGKIPNEPMPGWYAIGVNELYGSIDVCDWLKQYEPYAIIGYSIYVYHIKEKDLARQIQVPEPVTSSLQNLGVPNLVPSKASLTGTNGDDRAVVVSLAL